MQLPAGVTCTVERDDAYPGADKFTFLRSDSVGFATTVADGVLNRVGREVIEARLAVLVTAAYDRFGQSKGVS